MAAEQVYATLLLSDSYLPGALALGHSLRDAGITRRLAALITLDSVSADAITQLKTVYDCILPVPRIRNSQPANLYLMDRSELHSAFTKINLWKQTQFSKIVYLDADVLAYRAPDELFELQHAFSAAPDVGWPDIFNTGVMVLTPNMGDYYALVAMAERGISFDGADQGLLNMYFQNSFNRLSFAYNVTPSAHYQYMPAYRHFQSSINLVHFIGPNKPWFAGRNAPHGSSAYDEIVGRWWAVYDRHYRVQEAPTHIPQNVLSATYPPSDGQSLADPRQAGEQHASQRHEEATSFEPPSRGTAARAPSDHKAAPLQQHSSEPQRASAPRHIPQQSWDAQRQPPPPDAKPEAINFPSTHYAMSKDAGLFIPPARYPSPPKNMWFDVPAEPPAPVAEHPKQIFPWEGYQSRPSRSFADSVPISQQGTEPALRIVTESSAAGSSPGDAQARSSAPSTPTIQITPSDPWTSFPRLNAWDEMPEIGRYVEGLQKHRRVRSQGSPGGSPRTLSPAGLAAGGKRRSKPGPAGFRVTDFPSEVERPSLPVTPAPARRPSFWGEDEQDRAMRPLPTAEGVPSQSEWDPATQLQKLAQRQSEVLLRKLGGGGGDDEQPGEPSGASSRDIPSRPLPFGSERSGSPAQPRQTAVPDLASPRARSGAAAARLLRAMGSTTAGEPLLSMQGPSVLPQTEHGDASEGKR